MIKKLIYFGMIALLAILPNTKLTAQNPGENIDVTHYEIHLSNFNFTNRTLQGETYVTLNARSNTNTIVLELKTLTVSAVLCETTGYGINNWNQNGDLLTITLSETLSAGQTLTLDILYGGNTFNESWGGIMWTGNSTTNGYVCNMGVGFESIPHNLGKAWFPCVDNFTDKATYDVYVTVPTELSAVCGGVYEGTTDNGNGTTTVHYNVPQEIATYHISFVAGDYVEWTDTYNGVNGDIPITVYVKPSQINKVEGTFVNVKDIAAFYENCFGPYPFNRIGYAITSVGCMEHIDNIGITSGVLTGNTSQEEYIAHELSHMYFGNKVTCATAEDMWLNEGFAQFCGIFYRAAIYGEDDFQNAITAKVNAITNWCKNEANWIPLNNTPQDMTYDGNAVYNRGAVVVNTMMNYMGRETFLASLRHYLNTHAYGAASSEQLRDALTASSGIDMSGFFDTYVFTAGMPHYGVSLVNVAQNGSQYDATVKMSYEHVGPSHVGQNNRVEVTFINNAGLLQTMMVNWDGAESEQTVTLDIEPVAAFVDYYNHYLDAKIDKNLITTTNASVSIENHTAIVNSVTDSVLLRLEGHFVRPDNDPEIPWLTLSTTHYWNVYRHDYGNANVSGQFTFSINSDGDIIHTQNDSAVLLYRANALEAWHSIPYTIEGSWQIGRFTLSDLQSGQYTIAAIDKSLMGVNENNEPAMCVFPNPTKGIILGQTGHFQITNLSGKTIKKGMAQGQIDVSDLSAGAYLLTINGKTQKIIIQ